MLVLGLDTSCDDTGVALVEDGYEIRSNVVASQHLFHERYGGIVPTVASRQHCRAVNPLIEMALARADVGLSEIDGVAVSSDQGLAPCLAVGVAAAKALALGTGKPLVGVHHVEGHIYSNLMVHRDLQFPFLCLTVAGGHTMILVAQQLGSYQLIGHSRDDSAGEAYDKIARRLGLGYPGGPIIDKLARKGNPAAFSFPRPMMTDDSLEFSFSGLKTAVNRTIAQLEADGESPVVEDIAASFQEAVVDVLIEKTVRAVAKSGIRSLAVAGGVAANSRLRERLEELSRTDEVRVFSPPGELCIDNGAMIAGVGYHALLAGQRASLRLDACPNAPLGDLGIRYRHNSKYASAGRHPAS